MEDIQAKINSGILGPPVRPLSPEAAYFFMGAIKILLALRKLLLVTLVPNARLAADTDWRLRTHGFGPIKSGMIQAQVEDSKRRCREEPKRFPC